MTEAGHGLQVVSVNKFHQFNLEEEELKKLLLREDIKDLPVVVVSVAGAYRSGKSFLLNFFLRYLASSEAAQRDGSWLGGDSEPLTGFTWRSGSKVTTTGILMWSKPFIKTLPSGEKVAVVLMDTQGTFDSSSTFRDSSTILTLSTLVSSVQIYNLSQNIKEDDLQQLELLTEYGKLVNDGNVNAKAYQVLEFLVRDWQYPEEVPYGAAGGETMLKNKLETLQFSSSGGTVVSPPRQAVPNIYNLIFPFTINPISSNFEDTVRSVSGISKDRQSLIRHIRTSFEKISCFLMPHPGFKALRKSFLGNISDIDPDFRMQLVELVNSIFGSSKLIPKTINGEKIKAQDLFNYFKAYMNLFNSDELPTPENMMAVTVLLSASLEARDVYENGMDAECGPRQLSVPPVDLKFLHDKYYKMATDHFKNKTKLSSENDANKYFNKLKKGIDDRLLNFTENNCSKTQTAIKEATKSYNATIESIHKEKLLCLLNMDLISVHEQGRNAAIKTFDAGRKRVTQRQDDQRVKLIQSFEEDYDLLRHSNELNHTTINAELKTTYWHRIKSKLIVEPSLSSEELRTEHEDARNKALRDYDSKLNIPNQFKEDLHKYMLTQDINESFRQIREVNKSINKLAIFEGIDAYDSYIKIKWNKASECLHPEDLKELHRIGSCRALEELHPRKLCSAGFDKNDKDEELLKEILAKRYDELQRINANANESAVLYSYNKYVTEMNDKNILINYYYGRHSSINNALQLNVLPKIGLNAQRPIYTCHEKAKIKATVAFLEKRKASSYQISDDPYRKRLNEMIENAFKDTYE